MKTAQVYAANQW